MAKKFLYSELKTNKSISEIKDAIHKSFSIVGGEVEELDNGIRIKKGVNQVRYAFTTVNFTSTITINPIGTEKYNLECSITWGPHWLNFLMFLWGFVTIVTWIYNILFLLVKPAEVYKTALDRVSFYLE